MDCKTELSAIILLEEASDDFEQYIERLHDILTRRGDAFEVIIIANGMEGFLKSRIDRIYRLLPEAKAFSFPRRVPQSVCVKAAIHESCAKILIMCGSYQQLDEESFATILDALDDHVDLITPWRRRRVDPSFNQLQSWIFNRIVKFITGTQLHDLSCTTRVLRRDIVENIPLYGNNYRFLPILAHQRGYRVLEIPCQHFQERGKTGLYSLSSYLSRVADIVTLYFNTRFSRKPLRFFNMVGAGLIFAGFMVMLYVGIQKLFYGFPLGNRPELLTAVVLLVAGVETAGLGLLGEIIAFTHGRQRKEYTVEKVI